MCTKHTLESVLEQTHTHSPSVTHFMNQSVADVLLSPVPTCVCMCVCLFVFVMQRVIIAASGVSLQQLISIEIVFYFIIGLTVWIKTELKQSIELRSEITHVLSEYGYCHGAVMW